MNNRAFRLSGELSDFPLQDVIQFLGMTRKTGELRLFNGHPDPWASLFFMQELLTHAQCEKMEGVEAFIHILSQVSGHFHFFSDILPLKQTINKPVHFLMLQVQSQLDELNNLEKMLPPLETPLAISSQVDPVPSLNTQEWQVLSQINGRRTLYQILERTGEALQTKKTLLKLLHLHLIVPAADSATLSQLVPRPLLSTDQNGERSYPSRLRTNLLLKAIDGQKSLLQLCDSLSIKERELLEDIQLLLDSNWITFTNRDQLLQFKTLYEE